VRNVAACARATRWRRVSTRDPAVFHSVLVILRGFRL